jgi:hypothetical protein
MKRLITPVAIAIGIVLFAGTGPAIASPPTPIEPSSHQFDCPGFIVDAVITGKMKEIDAPLSSFPKSQPLKLLTVVGAASTATLTGPAPASKVLSFSQNGSIRIALDLSPGGDLVFTGTGRNLISLPQHGDYPGGLFLSVGKVTWTLNGPVDPNGGITGPGTVTDVCALLAP